MSEDNKPYQRAVAALNKFKQEGQEYIVSLSDKDLNYILYAMPLAILLENNNRDQRQLEAF